MKTKHKIGMIFLNLFFIFLCFICLIPILYALTISLNAKNDLLSSNFSFIPKSFTLQNYWEILVNRPFLLWAKNSLILSASTVVIDLTVAIPGAYVLSRKRFSGRKAILNLLILLNAFPAILSMFAVYRILKPVGLINTFTGLVLIYIGTMAIFALWNMKSYFDTIPLEIEEAAMMDGADDKQLIWRMVLPLARPSIIVTAVMILIYVWNEYIFAVTFINGADKYTLAAGLYSLQATDYTRNWPLFSAASLLVSFPVLIIFFCVQKYMVSGLTAGGVKG
ncbi:sugar ABC transporter permease [Caproicibacterium amylolyticum]|uniref:ABC transporter permease subunit n=1 Tax=Caproicibacterium amylolyticum TaxID=2766537 RepID=A0A7G9WGM5_9FIRM|nr:ABC transporter permease subunit [Caproicibacterium amylolyticum]QNO17837.1 ABC transporter permease subunit [Caproicibacterium amylolyticum]